MSQKTFIGGTSYEIMQSRTLVNGTVKEIFQGRTLVNGTGYDIVLGRPLYKYNIGETVKIYVNGVLTEFIVVHHGNPDTSMYVGCDDGTWLLQKNIQTLKAFDGKGIYRDSPIHSYLNNEYVSAFGSDVQAIMQEVKIPYTIPDFRPNIAGDTTEIFYGANGLSAKAFILSANELGFIYDTSTVTLPDDGLKLDYFEASQLQEGTVVGAEDRISMHNGSPTEYWTRTPWISGNDWIATIDDDGTTSGVGYPYSLGVRPCIILPSKTRTDRTGLIRP